MQIFEGQEKLEGVATKPTYYAKRNCRYCYGSGAVNWCFPGNHGDRETKQVFCPCVRVRQEAVEEVTNES